MVTVQYFTYQTINNRKKSAQFWRAKSSVILRLHSAEER